MDNARTDLDGLATFWGEAPGPPQAWLVFRVGAADETLSTRGITRLVIGLAIDGAGAGEAAYGAFAGGPTTSIELTGTADQVVTLLGQIWEGLASPDLDRFEEVREREILHSSWRRPDDTDHLLAMRFGPRGIGLVGQPEIGLHHIEPEAVLAWRDRFFTPANAALVLKNVSPDGLRLAARGPGDPVPLQPTTPRALTLPAWYEAPAEDVVVSSVCPGDAATDTFTATAVARLRKALGDAHRVGVLPVRIWTGCDHVTIRCSAPGRFAPAVRDSLIEVVERLAAQGPDEAEVEDRHLRLREWRADPDWTLLHLEWTAHAHVLGDALPGADDRPAPDAVAAAARGFLETAIYRLPRRVGMPLAYNHLGGSSDDEVTGTVYARAGDSASGALVVGEQGVTVTLDGRRVTIRFDACEAVAQWPDGTLDLYGSDGLGAQVRPKEWVGGDAAVEMILGRLRSPAVVMRPPRN